MQLDKKLTRMAIQKYFRDGGKVEKEIKQLQDDAIELAEESRQAAAKASAKVEKAITLTQERKGILDHVKELIGTLDEREQPAFLEQWEQSAAKLNDGK